ncbi:hypothetical protein BJV82DRAFT_672101 [Fennellomyces sp. T-0311]|nr:hypothetical protein BJV82DRAFT_672101 [Fennellomyces sp. T-0311]
MYPNPPPFVMSVDMDQTALDFTATKNAFEQANRAYAARDYDQAANFYTCALKAIQEDLILRKNDLDASTDENAAQMLDPVAEGQSHMLQLLPSEVISCILSELSLMDRGQLGMTCRFWNKHVFQIWPHMWQTVDANMDLFKCPDKYTSFFNAIRGDQVRNIITHVEWRDDNFFVLDSSEYESDDEDDCQDTGPLTKCDFEYFERIKAAVKNSLRVLTLNGPDRHSDYNRAVINEAVQELTKLQGTSQLHDFQLTSFYMPWIPESTTFASICQYLPALTSFTINHQRHDDYANILDAVTKYCPALEVLKYQMSNSSTGGLKELVFRPISMCYSVAGFPDFDTQLTALFQRGHGTLQTLDLVLDVIEGSGYTSFKTLARLGAPRLQTLHLVAWNGSSIGSQALASLLSSSPSLLNIKLIGLSIGYINNILNALATSRSIQRFFMDYYHTPNCDSSFTCVAPFFKMARSIYDFSLNDFHNDAFTPTGQFIPLLTQAIRSSTVRILDIQSHKLTTEQLLRTLMNLQNSQLQILKIRVTFETGNTVLDALAGIRNLTHLIVYSDLSSFNEDHLCRLLDRWKKPQMLVVEVRFKDPGCFIKGYKPDLATSRAAKDIIDDPKLRYSIRSSIDSNANEHTE